MFRYSGFALTIDSELELPQLPAGDGEPDGDSRVATYHKTARSRPLTKSLLITLLPVHSIYVMAIEVVVRNLAGGDLAALRVVLLGRIMAFLLRQRGWLPFMPAAF